MKVKLKRRVNVEGKEDKEAIRKEVSANHSNFDCLIT